MTPHLTRFLIAVAAAAALVAPLTVFAQARPDLKMEKGCQLDPTKGPQAVSCVLNVTNIGNVPSVSPITIVDNPVGPPGTTFTSSSGSFACTTPVGPLPPVISCGAPYSLAPSPASGSSGSTFLYFNVAQGGTFSNCASVSQGSNAATPKDPNLNNNKSCFKIEVPPPAGGKIAVIKQIVNNNPGIPTPGPFYVNLVCKPSGPSITITLTGSSLNQIVNVPSGSTCQIEEKPPVPPKGCKWSTTYPNGQTGKPGDKMVVQNELICEPKSCPAGQTETTFPGSTIKYCCDGKPGSNKFCCTRKN